MPLQPFQNQSLPLTQDGFNRLQANVANFLNGLLNQLQNPQFLGQIANGRTGVQKAYGTISTGQTLDCTSASSIAISLRATANLTLTLTNLAVGTPIVIRIAAGAGITFKVAATDPSGTVYSCFSIGTGGGQTDLTASGVALTGGSFYIEQGNSVTEAGGPTLYVGLI